MQPNRRPPTRPGRPGVPPGPVMHQAQPQPQAPVVHPGPPPVAQPVPGPVHPGPAPGPVHTGPGFNQQTGANTGSSNVVNEHGAFQNAAGSSIGANLASDLSSGQLSAANADNQGWQTADSSGQKGSAQSQSTNFDKNKGINLKHPRKVWNRNKVYVILQAHLRHQIPMQTLKLSKTSMERRQKPMLAAQTLFKVLVDNKWEVSVLFSALMSVVSPVTCPKIISK